MVDILKGHCCAAEFTYNGQQSYNHTIISEYLGPKHNNMLLRLSRIPIEVGLELIKRTI
jgi:hypothetical protein